MTEKIIIGYYHGLMVTRVFCHDIKENLLTMKLADFLNSLISTSTAGKESVKREVIKGFDLPRHGVDIDFLIQSLDSNTRKDERHVAINKVLGFNTDDGEKKITNAGKALTCKCTDSHRLVKNQYKKWRYPRAYNKGVNDTDIFPYWILLEFLIKFDECISSLEFITFVTTIKNRSELTLHVKRLTELRNSGYSLNTLPNFTLPKNTFDNFKKSMWSKVIGELQFFEHISFDKDIDEIRLSSIKSKEELLNEIDYFYSNYNCIYGELDSQQYLEFLYNPEVKSSITFPTSKYISNQMISEVSNKIKNSFPFKNLLLKGVPGTGKSHTLEEIIDNEIFQLKDGENEHECFSVSSLKEENVLRINIHADSKNSELMQGVAVSTNENNQIEYSEKQGLILNHIRAAILRPSLPFVIILEEIQENNLNRLIGDLIFLIENDRRVKFVNDYPEKSADDAEFVSDLTFEFAALNKIILPSLVQNRKQLSLCMPDNLYIFCTSNFRDDKKIMEDNLLRRFEVIEIYPDHTVIKNQVASNFFESLNNEIHNFFENLQETHPDRYQVGHANWMKVQSPKDFSRAFNKLVVDFKDVKELPWSYFKEIIENTTAELSLDDYDYRKLTLELQNYYFFGYSSKGKIVKSIEELFDKQNVTEPLGIQEEDASL